MPAGPSSSLISLAEGEIADFLVYGTVRDRFRYLMTPVDPTIAILRLEAAWAFMELGASERAHDTAREAWATLRERGEVERCVADLYGGRISRKSTLGDALAPWGRRLHRDDWYQVMRFVNASLALSPVWGVDPLRSFMEMTHRRSGTLGRRVFYVLRSSEAFAGVDRTAVPDDQPENMVWAPAAKVRSALRPETDKGLSGVLAQRRWVEKQYEERFEPMFGSFMHWAVNKVAIFDAYVHAVATAAVDEGTQRRS